MLKRHTILHWTQWLALAVFLFWCWVALFFTVIGYDSLSYHLPFATYIWNIGGGVSNYHLGPELTFYWRGFPKMAEMSQGFFWWLTGSLHAVVVPNILAAILYIYIAKRLINIPASLLVLGLFGNPMFSHSFVQSYVDLIAGLTLTSGFLLLLHFGQQLTRGAWKISSLWCGGMCLAFSAGCKHTMLLQSALVLAVVALMIVVSTNGASLKAKALVALVFIGLGSSGVSMVDAVVFRNPLYPVKVEVFGHILFDGPFVQYTDYPNYPVEVMNFPPVRFFLSASELDWAARGVRVDYDHSPNAGDDPLACSGARTGAWGGLLFVLIVVLCLFAVCLLRWRSGYYGLLAPWGCMLACLLTFLPMSQELRYSMAIYFILLPIALKWILLNRSLSPALLVGLWILFAYYQTAFIFSRLIAEGECFYTAGQGYSSTNFSAYPATHIFYINLDRAFICSKAYTGFDIIVSNEKKERDTFYPLGIRAEQIFLDQYLVAGWDGSSLIGHPKPNGPSVKMQFTLGLAPETSLVLKLDFVLNALSLDPSAPLGEIAVNGERMALLNAEAIKRGSIAIPLKKMIIKDNTLVVEIDKIPCVSEATAPWSLLAATIDAQK